MGKNPRVNGHNLTRLTISEGKRAEPHLMMAHPIPRRRRWVLAAIVILAVVAIALAGRSL